MSAHAMQGSSQFAKLEQALALARRDGRFIDAARLAWRLNKRSLAAQLYEQAGEYFDAAAAWREGGQASRALAAAMRVSTQDACYFGAARLAIEVSAALRSVSFDLEQFIAPYLKHPPATREDLEALFLLGHLYEVNEYLPQAISTYRRILRVDPNHAALERLHVAEAAASQSVTTEVLVSHEDVYEVRAFVRSLHSVVPSSLHALAAGTVLGGRYRLEGLLGTGSHATVFRARDEQRHEDVALKLIHNVKRDSAADARFRREVSLARSLTHENVVRTYDLSAHGVRNFVTMELLDGTDLRAYVTDHELDDAAKRDLLLQICAGLGYAHACRVVHRDVKPENLFVTSAGVVKIADFAMAKAPGDTSATMTGAIGGTPYYMSPEQITDFRSVDHRTDLYALGVVAYELFTGQLPFYANSLTDLLLMHLERKPVPLRELRPELPPALDAVVLKLLAKAREDRYQSCAQLADALYRIDFDEAPTFRSIEIQLW